MESLKSLKNLKSQQILLMAVFVVLVIFAFLWMPGRLGEAVVEPELGLYVSGQEGIVSFSKDGDVWGHGKNGMLLKEGYYLRTGKDSKAILSTPLGSVLRLNEETEIKIAQLSLRDILLNQYSGRTYHLVNKAQEGVYQVRALNHTIKAVGTVFDVSVNKKVNRINTKVLESKINMAINVGEIIEIQKIGKDKEITVDPASDNIIAIADINQEYINSEWFNWNKEEDKKYGFELDAEDEIGEEVTENTITKTVTSTPTKTVSIPKTTYTGGCKPFLTAKKASAYNAIQLNWSICTNDDFQFYKLVRSTLNSSPSYPNDSAVTSSSNRSYSSFLDKTVAPARTYYYRVCVVQRLNKVTCGNVVSATY